MTTNHTYYYDAARRKNNWSEGDLAIALNHVLKLIGMSPDTRLLEVGCGRAEILSYIPASVRYTGIDPSLEVISEATLSFPSQHFVAGYSEQLPFADNSFDVVFLSQVLQSFTDPRQAMREIVRVLAPGGDLIIIAPNLENPFSAVPGARHYSSYKKILFTVLRVKDTVLRLFGAKVFRILPQNYTEATGLFEKGDDDLRYITSAYEVARYLKFLGLSLVYRKPQKFGPNLKDRVKKLLVKMPILAYYQGGMMFIFRK